MKSNKCQYLNKECKEPYDPNHCLNNYKKCFEHGRQKFLENYSDFEDTALFMGVEKILEDEHEVDK